MTITNRLLEVRLFIRYPYAELTSRSKRRQNALRKVAFRRAINGLLQSRMQLAETQHVVN